jgi:FdhD protein
MTVSGAHRTPVQRVRDGRSTFEDDALAVEEPLEIRVGRAGERGVAPRSLSVTMRTPGNDFELAVGFLFTEGILRSREDLHSVEYTRDGVRGPSENIVDVTLERGVEVDFASHARNFYATSSCGVCGKASLDAIRVLGVRPVAQDGPTVSAGLLSLLPERLREAQTLFAATGGLHAAGLFDTAGRLLCAREDIGRHNAVDKVLGERFLAGKVPPDEAILVVSGRAGFEILQKAAVARVPIVVAVGAPSTLAVQLAQEFGMTLVGFARDRRFNVYAGAQRLAEAPLAGSAP